MTLPAIIWNAFADTKALSAAKYAPRRQRKFSTIAANPEKKVRAGARSAKAISPQLENLLGSSHVFKPVLPLTGTKVHAQKGEALRSWVQLSRRRKRGDNSGRGIVLSWLECGVVGEFHCFSAWYLPLYLAEFVGNSYDDTKQLFRRKMKKQ